MSVSWQPSFRPTYIGNPLPAGGGLGTHSTSSGDYGNWFGTRPPLTFPLSRRIPTRKLGALNVNDSEAQPNNVSQMGNTYSQSNDLDQTGKVTSFLSKVNGESRVPRSPRTPDLTDLPGRMVRAPRTRHMTPRNSPDLYERAELEDNYSAYKDGVHQKEVLGDVTKGVGNLNTTDVLAGYYSRKPERPLIDRGNSLMDWNNDNRKAMSDSGIMGLERSRTMVETVHNAPLKPVTPRDYVIPKFPLERSNTNPNFLERSNTTNFNVGATSSQPRNYHETLMSNHMQRSQTMLEGSGRSNSWNFRRVPSFHGNFPGGNMPPQRAEDIQQQPSGTNQYPVNGHMSRYLFSMAPDSNVVKNAGYDMSEQDSLKPRMPMYWLYGSRGRPNGASDIPLSYESSAPHTERTPLDHAQVLDQDRRSNSLADTDFVVGGSERRDAYRSNYSSYEDQRKPLEPETSEHKVTTSQEPMVNLDIPKIKSILKKTSSSQGGHSFAGVPSARMKTGPGGRLPHLNTTKRNNTKRVKFSL